MRTFDDWTEQDIEAFVAQNRPHWEPFVDRFADAKGKLLVDVTYESPREVLSVCTFANYLCAARNLEPVYLLRTRNVTRERFCESFYPGEMVYVNRRYYSTQTKVAGARRFLRAYLRIWDVEDLLDLCIEGVPIGDLVYSSATRTSGEGTFEYVDRFLYRRLLSAIFFFSHCDELYRKRDIEAFVGHHHFYERNGIPFRVGIKNGADSYCYKNGAGIIRRYRELKDVKLDFLNPRPSLVDCVREKHCGMAESVADELLAASFGITPPPTTADASLSVDSNTPDLLVENDLPTSNQTVLVLPHVFVENLRFEHGLFRDYLVWLREVLRHASSETKVNWLVKPHPERDGLGMKQTTEEEVAAVTNGQDTTIRCIPADTPPAAMLSATDVLATVDGSAGLEFSCYGIPAVLAGDSYYSGFGVTNEPGTKADYFDTLSNPRDIPRLSADQRELAKVLMYLDGRLLRGNTPIFREGWARPLDPHESLWTTEPAANDFYEDVKHFVREDRRHLIRVDAVEC